MGLTDLFKGKEYRAQIEALEKEKASLEAMLTPEMKDALKLQSLIQQLTEEQTSLDQDIASKKSEIENLNAEIESKKSEIIVNDEIIELEEFSFYKPRYSFMNSEAYKQQLTEIRNQQKDMVKSGTAATGSTTWTVNGNAAQGRKMVRDMIKLCLRSFNNECDVAVAAVKFNNYDRYVKRIEKSFETIAKLGVIMNVSISLKYKALKIQELQLALEYQTKKQEEKEALKELRAQQREEARLAKEIEEARKAAYKEQAHYQRAYETITKQLSACADEVERDALLQKQEEIKCHLTEVEDNLKSIDYREANQRAGYVYVISNIGSFGKNVYKIGMTRRLEPMDRVDELSDASVPFNFDVHAMIFSDDAPSLELALHKAFEDRKINMINHRREFFKVSLEEIKKVVKENHDKTVEFVENPEAEQYRETLKLLNAKGLQL